MYYKCDTKTKIKDKNSTNKQNTKQNINNNCNNNNNNFNGEYWAVIGPNCPNHKGFRITGFRFTEGPLYCESYHCLKREAVCTTSIDRRIQDGA